MDLRKAALLMLSFNLLQGLIQLRHEWEMEKIARQRETEFFIHQMNIQTACFLAKLRKKRAKRRCWVKTRSHDWWERIVPHHFTEVDWLENFKMSSATFKFICERLRPYLEPIKNAVRKPASVEKKVAITLYKLASCAEYRLVANQFGTHKSMVHKCLYKVCEAIYEEFKNDFLVLPNNVEDSEIMMCFEKMCGLPNAFGAIDGTHIPILPPSDGYRDFINRKGWASYNMMAVVDHLYRFRYATCKHPGNAHDANVLKDSSLYQSAQNLLPRVMRSVNSVEVPCMLLGDPAYPLLPWLLKGYKGSNITAEEQSFNVYLSRGRVVVENAFGRLKAHFRCLLKRADMKYKFVPKMVIVCLILHNIIETRKDTFQQRWLDAVEQAEIEYVQPASRVTREADDVTAADIRNNITEFMAAKFPLLSSRLS